MPRYQAHQHQPAGKAGLTSLPRQPMPLAGEPGGVPAVPQLARGRGIPPNRAESIEVYIAAGESEMLSHALGRLPTGWRVVDLRSVGDVPINAPLRRTQWGATSLTLVNDSDVGIVVRVEVF